MKIEFTGLTISDLAQEYYRLLGSEKDREQARKNLIGLKPHTVKLDVLKKAMKKLHKKQKSELKAFRESCLILKSHKLKFREYAD